MEYEIQNTNDELTHWGVKGMRWGVRRYQRRDGSLTKAGKRRYESQMEAIKEKEKVLKRTQRNKNRIDKLNAKKGELEEWEKELKGKGKKPQTQPSTPRQKSVSEMTLEELRAQTERMNAERNYYEARKNLAAANPRKVSMGEKFAKSLMNDVIAPAAKNAGKAYLENFMKDKLGIKEEKSVNWDSMLKKQSYEKNQREQALEDIRRELQIIDQQAKLDKARAAAKAAKKNKGGGD